jgi:hypothetical protein
MMKAKGRKSRQRQFLLMLKCTRNNAWAASKAVVVTQLNSATNLMYDMLQLQGKRARRWPRVEATRDRIGMLEPVNKVRTR